MALKKYIIICNNIGNIYIFYIMHVIIDLIYHYVDTSTQG